MRKSLSASFRSVLFLSGMVTPALLLGALCMAQDSKPTAPPTAKQQYKNIKVLKDLPADQLIPVMRKWNASLGVKCDFCHVINADHTGFDKDDKHAKLVARQMVSMTMDINKRYKAADKKVTCFTCHHGHQEPEGAPAAP